MSDDDQRVTNYAPRRLSLVALATVPRVVEGDDLATFILDACKREDIALCHGDVLVVAQKVVSKAEGRRIPLGSVEPSRKARRLARRTEKDPRLVELILRESRKVLRVARAALIVEHRLGLVMANAGIDQSNVEGTGTDVYALLLPEDPDRSAAALRCRIETLAGIRVGVIINDSIGRAWRLGSIGTAIGIAGMPALIDLRGVADLDGRQLRTSELAIADELASAASLCMGQAAEGRPVVVVRGLTHLPEDSGSGARALIRPLEQDLFR